MRLKILKILNITPQEAGPVFMLLGMSFFVGLFLATVAVASISLFLNSYSETVDLPLAFVISGVFSVLSTSLYSSLQGKIKFTTLATISLFIIIAIISFIRFGHHVVENEKLLYYFGFTQILSFNYISQLIFWETFNRLFSVQQAKRILNSVDIGMDVASLVAFFTIPLLLNLGMETVSLFTISLLGVVGYLIFYIILVKKHLTNKGIALYESKKLSIKQFLGDKYIVTLSLFIIFSTIVAQFVDFSFLNMASVQFDHNNLPYFLSYFEGATVTFTFLFTLFLADKVRQEYGLRVSLLLNPLLTLLFTVAALGFGTFLGYDPSQHTSVYFFFIMLSMSKLFVNSMKEAIDESTFRLHYIPLDKTIKIDAQTKIEGIVIGLASTLGGAFILIVNQFPAFTLLSMSFFTTILLGGWILVVVQMKKGYLSALKGSLNQNKHKTKKGGFLAYSIRSILRNKINHHDEKELLYSLKLTKELDPALFEATIIKLVKSPLKNVKKYAEDKVKELKIGNQKNETSKSLAQKAKNDIEHGDMLSISPKKLVILGKSIKQSDRILTAKLLRTATDHKTIFTLLELLRDQDSEVKQEALTTARKVKRPETWNVLIEMLDSPMYANHATSALIEAGEPTLEALDTSFYRSGQIDVIRKKIILIIGHIQSPKATHMLWKKINYPDQVIVNQILYSLKDTNHQINESKVSVLKEMLDAEMSKMLWNFAAIDELPKEPHLDFLIQALQEETKNNYNHIILLLSLLYDSESIQLVKENIDSKVPENITYAIELLNLFIDPDLKPKLIPLLDGSPTSNKMEKLQLHFSRERYSPKKVIEHILYRNIHYNNRWTNLCAIHTIAYMKKFKITQSLVAQIFSEDKIAQEITAWTIYNKDSQLYESIAERIPVENKKDLDQSIKKNQLIDGLNDGFFLGVEIVMFLKQIPFFRKIEGNLLCSLADKTNLIPLHEKEKKDFLSSKKINPIFIIAHGRVSLTTKNGDILNLEKGSFYGNPLQQKDINEVVQINAYEQSVIFSIPTEDFYFVLANHPVLLQELIENTNQ